MRITLLFEPSNHRPVPFASGLERYQRLADELSRYAGVQVRIVKDILRKTPTDSYVLFAGSGDVSRSLAECSPARAAELAPRIVLLDVSWQKALEQLEKHKLAGAVDSLRLSEWLARPSSCTGPFGLRYLSKSLRASCVPLPSFCSRHYCLLQSTLHRGLPHLLADYLAIYDRDQQPLSEVPSVSVARMVWAPKNGESGQDERKAGLQEGTVPTSQVESVSIKRAIASLMRARETAHMPLLKVAETSGLDLEQLTLLEGNDYSRATLGTLRAYVQVLEAAWGWTLAEEGDANNPTSQGTQQLVELAPKENTTVFVPGAEAEYEAEIRVEGGMTVQRNRRARRQYFKGELDMPTGRSRREMSNAGV